VIANLVLFGASGDLAGRFLLPALSRPCTRRAGFRKISRSWAPPVRRGTKALAGEGAARSARPALRSPDDGLSALITDRTPHGSETIKRYGRSALPKGSLVADWPFSYHDLEPYYDKVVGVLVCRRHRPRSIRPRRQGRPRRRRHPHQPQPEVRASHRPHPRRADHHHRGARRPRIAISYRCGGRSCSSGYESPRTPARVGLRPARHALRSSTAPARLQVPVNLAEVAVARLRDIAADEPHAESADDRKEPERLALPDRVDQR
jgi:hypothetical protein